MSIVTLMGYVGIGIGSAYLGSRANDNKELVQNMVATILVMIGMYGVVVA